MSPELEQLIDKHGLAKVLSTISEICAAKAEHIQSSYNDKPLASMWRKYSNLISTTAGRIL
jgi:hypothetical protein